MKKWKLTVVIALMYFSSLAMCQSTSAQCSICTRTAQQQGERPAKALNAGILYLACMPLAIFGILGYRWWKSNRQAE
jgi:hypothetical protein